MARIRPDWIPSLTSNAGDFTFGFDFSADIPITAFGLYWYQVDDPDSPSSVTARLYDTSTETLLVSGTNSSLSPGWNEVLFTVPLPLSASTTYTAGMETTGVHAYDADQLDSPITDPTGHVTIPAGGGRFLDSYTFPSNTWTGMHAVDLSFITFDPRVSGFFF